MGGGSRGNTAAMLIREAEAGRIQEATVTLSTHSNIHLTVRRFKYLFNSDT